MLRPTLFAGCAIAAGVLGGCSESRIIASADDGAAPAKPEAHAATRPAKTEIGQREIGQREIGQREVGQREVRQGELGQRFATAALDDRQLGGIRGGMSTGSGMMVNFSFQEATYVNHNLTQNIIVPTMTISPGSTPAAAATMTAGASSVAGIGGTAAQTQLNAPTQVVQSVVNGGMTSVVSSLGAGGVTNHVSNTANNQLVQQMITANIGITGLGQAIQQGVASTIMSRVQAANAQFH